jgi:hypothetical protein
MTDNTTSSAPGWFRVVAGIALVWNLLGVMAYLQQAYMSPEAMAALTDEMRALMESTPAWAHAAFATAVHAGALGSLALLLKKAWAAPVLMLSLAAVIVQMIHSFFMSNSFEVFGPGGMIMPVMVIVIAVYLVMLAIKAKKSGWIS